ncbi:MAG: hypothetical protein V7K26_03580 [Nostoc sp.]|uniref:hypothetical protein n=1 Tax=Nostoc sp. TaxID=1180 RepID=UPI002FEEC67D
MNSDASLQPQSNPAWRFYLTWHSCEYSKALIDEALSIMSKQEFPSAELYPRARDLILSASRILEEQGHFM